MALKQAQATIQLLQTKIAHAELAHAEELAGERQKLEAALAVQAVHKEEIAAPVPEAKTAEAPVRPARRSKAKAAPVQEQPEFELEAEPEPVEWWVAGWQKRLRR